jgi:flagellar basal body rod protein FlgB
MKQYLIRIENGRSSEHTTINGDSLRPFMIAHNLWNYTTPGHAARRLEKLAQAWENNGYTVKRIFGGVSDMPTQGNKFNVEKTLLDFSNNASTKAYTDLIKKHYHY